MHCINQLVAGEQALYLSSSCLLQKILQGLPGQQVITELPVHGGISCGGSFVCGLEMSWKAGLKQRPRSSEDSPQRAIRISLICLFCLMLWAWKEPLQNNMVLHSPLSKLISYFFTSFLISLANQISWWLYSSSKHYMKYYFSQVSDLTSSFNTYYPGGKDWHMIHIPCCVLGGCRNAAMEAAI